MGGFCPSYAAAYADSPGSGVLAAWASVGVGVGVGVVEVVVVAAAAVIGQSPLVVVIGPGAASSSAAPDHRHERLRHHITGNRDPPRNHRSYV